MVKKLNKFAILTIIILFALTIPVFARQVTVDEIGTELEALEKKNDTTINSFYIIGNYVFTSDYILDTRDIMLAARSISMTDGKEYDGTNKEQVLKDMTIHEVERTKDAMYNPTGWKIKDNYVGETDLTKETKLNICYIDYEYLKDIYTVTLETDNEEYQKSIKVEEDGLIDKELITGKNAPTKEGKKFKEWVLVKEDGTEKVWDFDKDTVNGPITLKATWYEEVKFTVLKELPEEAKGKIKEAMNKLGFNPEQDDYKKFINGVTITTEGDGVVKFNGVLPKVTGVNAGFYNDGKDYGYYIVYVIHTEKGKDACPDLVITIPTRNSNGDYTTKEIKATEFDTNNDVAVLMKVDPNGIDGKGNKVFTIKVDMDGEKTDYQPYEVKVDYSGLKFEQSSTANLEITNQFSQIDKEQFETWGYDASKNENVTIENGLVKGTLKEQKLQSADAFGEDGKDGYFFTFDIKVDKDKVNEKTKIQIPDGKNEDGSIKFKDLPYTDFQDGTETILYRIDKDIVNCDGTCNAACCKEQGEGECNCKKIITVKVDYDGEDPQYDEASYTIDYCKLNLVKLCTVKFKDGSANDIEVYKGETIAEIKEPEKDYHKFVYWAEEDGTEFKIGETTITDDITLVPHWNLYSDKFISDVLKDLNKTEDSQSQDFSKEFVIEDYVENSGEVTITVKDPTTKLSRMNDTSIPGAIAYILLKDEIQEITLSVNGIDKKFTKGEATDIDTLKETIQKGAQELYSQILKDQFGEDKTDKTITLSDLANKKGCESFTLSINPEKIASTVKLAKAPSENGISLANGIEVPTEYTFTFKSDIVTVRSQEELENALKRPEVETIYIGENFSVTNSINIDREVLIDGGTNKYTISAKNDIDSIFKITAENVTIDNIKLKDDKVKKAILVESGSLKTTGLEIVADNDNVSETFEAAIEVGKSASLTAKQLTYEKETYEKPAVKANKENATVNLTDKDLEQAVKIEKEKITKVSASSDTKATDSEYKYYNYYNNKCNSKIYETVFFNYLAGYRVSNTKYNYYGETITPPTSAPFTQFTYDGETYKIIGFSEFSSRSIIRAEEFEGGKIPEEITQDKLPQDVIIKDGLKATENKHYWASFMVTPTDGVEIVSSEAEFKTAFAKEGVKSIYITNNITIDYSTDESLTIKKDISIIGKSGNTPTIKAKKIVIDESAKDVFMNRVNLEISAQEKQEALIEVSGEKFTLWQSGLENKGNAVDYAIKYNNAKSVVDVRWMGLGSKGFNATNINKAYIYVAGKMAEGSDIYFNTFNALSSIDKSSAVIIKGFDASAEMTEDDNGEPDIRFAANTYRTKYAFEILKEASSQKADILFDTNSKTTIAIEHNTDNNDFSGIKLKSNVDNITTTYINADNQEESNTIPEGVKGIVVQSEIVTPGSTVPEAVTIEGFKQNGNTYSGVVNQSADGKFYLPVALTSNNFQNNVSTVKVIDPNGKEETYTYSLNNENGNTYNTMKLQLEAIKSSKITSGNGKVYKIELDEDGTNANEAEIKEYTIDYNGVDTLEEIINKAAESTQNANNLTYTKNNKVKGHVEDFTVQYDKELGRQYYKDEKVEEYSFLKKDFINDKEYKSFVCAVKDEVVNTNDGRVYLNDWRYSSEVIVGMGVNELSLLRDLIKKDETVVNSIDRIVEKEDNTYEITINEERLKSWLNALYLDAQDKEEIQGDLNEHSGVKLIVTLTEAEDGKTYIGSIKTSTKFSITDLNNVTTNDNKIDVTIEKVGTTILKTPQQMLGKEDETEVTKEQIVKFIQDGETWWSKHTGSTRPEN